MRDSVPEFITQDSATLGLLELASRIAPTNVPVLILGESGTGKEVIARRIHALSSRSRKSIISINCGAIQESLLLSELFGHERGAFTGAVSQKKGMVELADGGTLFLDEIGEMGFETQAKLLRFLQDGELYRVGGNTPIKVDVRIISATNKDLEMHVKQGKLREDLYYRINTVTLKILPLRKRPHDIPLLIGRFLRDGNLGLGRARSLAPRAVEILKRYSWPGNVRELQNTVERFKILVDEDVISEGDIPFNIKNPEVEMDYFDGSSSFLLEQVERRHILKVLAHFNGNKTRAADAMGITVKTLYNKLSRYEKLKHADSSHREN